VLSTLELNVFGRTLADRATWTAVQVRDCSCCMTSVLLGCVGKREAVMQAHSYEKFRLWLAHGRMPPWDGVAWLPCRRRPLMMRSRNPT
jgi:hypothetical protein